MQKILSVVDNLDWQELNQILVETAKEVFGETSGKGDIHRERELGGGKKKFGKQVGLKKFNIQAVPDDQE